MISKRNFPPAFVSLTVGVILTAIVVFLANTPVNTVEAAQTLDSRATYSVIEPEHGVHCIVVQPTNMHSAGAFGVDCWKVNEND